MGLFSRKTKKSLPVREFNFNKDRIQSLMNRIGRSFFDYRNDEGHQRYTRFIEGMVDLEILEMTRTKELTSEAYAYHRGRIDSLRSVLSHREKYILDEEHAKKIKDKKSKADNPGMRQYVKPPSSAGLS